MSKRCTVLWILAASTLVAPFAGAQEQWPTKGWAVATPQSVGLDPGVLSTLEADITAGAYGYIDCLLIIRYGRIVVDRSWSHDYDRIYGKQAHEPGPLNAQDPSGPYNYFNPWWHPFYRRGGLHSMQSVTKTVSSAIIGAAVTRGDFPALETQVLRYFDEKKVANVDERKRRLTIRHLLTMTGGFEWNEDLPYDDPKNSCSIMEACADWVQYAIDRPMAREPGTEFRYNSGESMLLAYIFRAATGMDIEEYAAKYLFAPLGIVDWYWKRTPTGPVDGEGGLYLTARDLAKIAYLFLRKGRWEGRQVLTEDWVKASVSPALPKADDGWYYGYKWWLIPYAESKATLGWAGSGFGGQLPIILADEGLVIVVTAWNVLTEKRLGHMEIIRRVRSALEVFRK